MREQEEEYQVLLEKQFWLKYLIDHHIKNRLHSSMSDQEFEEYVNAALDELLDIRKRLKTLGTDQP